MTIRPAEHAEVQRETRGIAEILAAAAAVAAFSAGRVQPGDAHAVALVQAAHTRAHGLHEGDRVVGALAEEHHAHGTGIEPLHTVAVDDPMELFPIRLIDAGI